MKWKTIDEQDWVEVNLTLNLFVFLETINIKSATKMADASQEILDECFCSSCESAKEYCECHQDHEYDYDDGDRAYDSWKDSQLENEDN